jgi:hypothetical protein
MGRCSLVVVSETSDFGLRGREMICVDPFEKKHRLISVLVCTEMFFMLLLVIATLLLEYVSI